MSLLDALQAAGALDKKAAAKAKREAKRARKKQQGSLEKKKVIESREQEASEQAQLEQLEARRGERLARAADASIAEAALTAVNLIGAWSISFSVGFKTTSFSFESTAGASESVELPEFLVQGVRSGALGLARGDAEDRISVLPRGAISKLNSVMPSAVLYFYRPL